MTVQRIGILATRIADLGLIRRHIDVLFAGLPPEATWEFRYYRSAARFAAALGSDTLTIGVLVHTDARKQLPVLPAGATVLVIRTATAAASTSGAATSSATVPQSDALANAPRPGHLALESLNPTMLQQALRDAIRRAELGHEVRYLEHHDATTGLPRTPTLLARLEAQLPTLHGASGKVAAEEFRHSLYCIALQGFAELEHALGIATADKLLRLAAQRLVAVLKRGELIARGEGAEFVLFVRHAAGEAAAMRRGRQFAKLFDLQFELSESSAFVTTAIGVAPARTTQIRAAAPLQAVELLHQARAAADAASITSAHPLQLFSPALLRESRRQKMTEALGYAIERDEFEVFYQPLVDLRSGAVSGAEALLRWHGNSVGAVGPGQFIPLAEESGAILSIGEWVMQRACREAVTWLDRFWLPVRLAVNVSAEQFRSRRLQQDLLRCLSEMPLRAEQIELEISERNYLELVRTHYGEFEALRDLGFRIVIDDFGTSYASLSYLKQFPVDVLKIDRSFVAPLPGTAGDAALVRAIIAMGKNLGMRVVGVGVETEAQLEFLRDAGCDEAQGFYLGQPMPGDEFIAVLLRNPPVAAPGMQAYLHS